MCMSEQNQDPFMPTETRNVKPESGQGLTSPHLDDALSLIERGDNLW
jgi:hypothetical protein